jgi:hypothetical protein
LPVGKCEETQNQRHNRDEFNAEFQGRKCKRECDGCEVKLAIFLGNEIASEKEQASEGKEHVPGMGSRIHAGFNVPGLHPRKQRQEGRQR